jgi:hypothetical protein
MREMQRRGGGVEELGGSCGDALMEGQRRRGRAERGVGDDLLGPNR